MERSEGRKQTEMKTQPFYKCYISWSLSIRETPERQYLIMWTQYSESVENLEIREIGSCSESQAIKSVHEEGSTCSHLKETSSPVRGSFQDAALHVLWARIPDFSTLASSFSAMQLPHTWLSFMQQQIHWYQLTLLAATFAILGSFSGEDCCCYCCRFFGTLFAQALPRFPTIEHL